MICKEFIKGLDKLMKQDILLLSARGSAETLMDSTKASLFLGRKAFFFVPDPYPLRDPSVERCELRS
jgi:hypothetical protein